MWQGHWEREQKKTTNVSEFILHSAKIPWSQVIAQYTVISKHLSVHHFGVFVGLCILTIFMHIYKIHPYLQTSLSTCLTFLIYVVRSFIGIKKWHISKQTTVARALTDMAHPYLPGIKQKSQKTGCRCAPGRPGDGPHAFLSVCLAVDGWPQVT